MNNTVQLTKEMLLNASDYIANSDKEAWVADTAPKCFDRLSIAVNGDTMPEMYMVNTGLKSRYLMTAFVKQYLKQEYEADGTDAALMSDTEYDKWAGGHVFCQVDRWKRDVDVRDKCYDLLYDYHDLEKRFTSQIMGLLTIQNDSVLRQSQYMETQFKQLPEVISQLKELQTSRMEGQDGN